jgi:hypothetical protein
MWGRLGPAAPPCDAVSEGTTVTSRRSLDNTSTGSRMQTFLPDLHAAKHVPPLPAPELLETSFKSSLLQQLIYIAQCLGTLSEKGPKLQLYKCRKNLLFSSLFNDIVSALFCLCLFNFFLRRAGYIHFPSSVHQSLNVTVTLVPTDQ